MSIAFVTNSAPSYRVPLFKELADQLDACFYFHDSELTQVSADDYPFPAQFLRSQSKVWKALSESDHEAVISGVSGRTALPLTYLSCKHADRPFILWASLWAHPRTPFHRISSIPLRRIYRKADAVVTYGPHVSSYVADQRGNETGIFEATQAVDNGFFSRQITIDEQQGLREELGLGSGPIVLFVGRLVEEKGLRYLLRTWQGIERERDEVLVVAGEGKLSGLAEGLSGVRLVGQQKPDLLPILYSLATVLVLPSIMTSDFLEPWGLVVNEAMNQGVPVIASESVGAVAAGLVRDGQNGIVVRERDPQELADAIERILANQELRESLGSQALSDISGYTHEKMVDGFRQALGHALSN